MPFQEEDPVAFANESEFNRTARAVRYVERLMQNPEKADHQFQGRSVEALVSVTSDARRRDGKYRGYIYYKNKSSSTTTPSLPPTPNLNLSKYGQMPDTEFITYDEQCLVMDINKGVLYPNQFYKGMIQTDFEGYPLILVTAVPRAFAYSNRGYSGFSDDNPGGGVILSFRTEWNTGCGVGGDITTDTIEYTIVLILINGELTGSISMTILEEDRVVVPTVCKEFVTNVAVTVVCVAGVLTTTVTQTKDKIRGIACEACP